ncbi:uncharacterized protein LOC130648426 [Hydractinia symbiolongicarpus]|uniref:uncharacterized protein LOC130648426 n=1 Tax=Hydractinia symbiolongicarpus TaxID=13093 RepID=UPI00254A5C44|nr:uncharacterized protein LOC130648426 [Hydractinia symbiolongicarpus]
MDLLHFLCGLAIFFVVLANAEENNEDGPPAFHNDALKIKSDEDSDGDDGNDEVGVPPWLVPLYDKVDAENNLDEDSDGDVRDDDEVESSMRNDRVNFVVASDVKDAYPYYGRRRRSKRRRHLSRRRRRRSSRRRQRVLSG